MCQIPSRSSPPERRCIRSITRCRTCIASRISSADTQGESRLCSAPLLPPKPKLSRLLLLRLSYRSLAPRERNAWPTHSLLQNQRPITLQYNPITETIEVNENRIKRRIVSCKNRRRADACCCDSSLPSCSSLASLSPSSFLPLSSCLATRRQPQDSNVSANAAARLQLRGRETNCMCGSESCRVNQCMRVRGSV